MRQGTVNEKSPAFGLSAKIITIVLVSILCSTAFIGWLIYNANKRQLVSSLRDSLERISNTASLFIDGDMHQTISSPDDKAYKDIRSLLQNVKNANGIDAPLYTLKKSEGRNEVECVITTESVTLLGAKYKMQDEMLTAFQKGVATSTGIYQTETGIWISSYAPIKNGFGMVVAVLKVQRHAEYIQDALRAGLILVIFFCTIAFLVGSVLSVFFVRQITAGIEKLNNSARALELGDYDSKIEAGSNDEIGQLALTLDKMRVSLKENIKELKDMWVKEKRAHLESILTLSKAIEIRDPYAKGHIERVTEYSLLMARKLGIAEELTENLKFGCILHDLGKLGINISILEKTALLTAEEKKSVEMHPVYGAEIIKGVKFLEVASDICLYHHERYDGSGYPFRLKGDNIPLLARIVSLADAFDAMVSDRPYRKKMGDEEAFSIIKSEGGRQFDPKICRVFLESKGEILKIKDRYAV